MATCSECCKTGVKRKHLYTDPRDPPLEEEPCLCSSCIIWVSEDLAEELRAQADSLERDVAALKKKQEARDKKRRRR